MNVFYKGTHQRHPQHSSRRPLTTTTRTTMATTTSNFGTAYYMGRTGLPYIVYPAQPPVTHSRYVTLCSLGLRYFVLFSLSLGELFAKANRLNGVSNHHCCTISISTTALLLANHPSINRSPRTSLLLCPLNGFNATSWHTVFLALYKNKMTPQLLLRPHN